MISKSALFAAAAFAAAAAAPLPAAALQGPKVTTVTSLDQLAVPDHPYDENADADADVNAAFARARTERKLVLIDLGGNWCVDCIILSGILSLPEVNAFVDAHYVTVYVDVGRFNRNLQIPARFGITKRLHGVPAVLIATPDGGLVDQGHIEALDDARAMTPQAISDWLAQWAR
jgi:hypothetical protein